MPPSADDRLRDIRRKIQWAKKHLGYLNTALQAFYDTKPYIRSAKRDPETRRPVYYLSKADGVPDEIALITGDIFQCLRSALDHLAYQLVLVGGGTPTKKTQFPIIDWEKDYVSLRNRSVVGMRPEAVSAIDALKPYSDQGGNQILWRLYRLNNIDKHRLVLTIGAAYRSLNVGNLLNFWSPEMAEALGLPPDTKNPLPKFDLFLNPSDRLFPLKVNDELFIDLPDSQIDENMEFQFEVALGETNVAFGDSLVAVVAETGKHVENVIETFRPLLA